MNTEIRKVALVPGKEVKHEEGTIYSTPGALRGYKSYLVVEFPADGGQAAVPGYRVFSDTEIMTPQGHEVLSATQQVTEFARRYHGSHQDLANDPLYITRVDVGPGQKPPVNDGVIYPGIAMMGRR